MPEFVIPVDLHINTRGGDLDIPAGATVHTRDDGHYQGFTPPDVASGASEPDLPPATPAALEHAAALGVDLTQVEGSGKDGTILKVDVAAAAESG